MRKVSSSAALKEMKQVAKKQVKNIKGIMKKVGVQKVKKRRSVGDAVSVGGKVDGEEYENVTVYDIEVDDTALAAKGFDPPVTQAPESENASVLVPEKTIPAENLIQVVLFLTDNTKSRFELVKFDLDSSKARINEMLNEIPNLATDETLRAKKYVAICSRKGAEMGKFKLVNEYFRREGNNTVSNFALAVQEGMTAKDAVRVSKPILSDDKILSMLNIEKQPESDLFSSTKENIKQKQDTPTPASLSPSSSDAESTDTEEADPETDTLIKPETGSKQMKSNVKASLFSTFAIFFIAALAVYVKQYNQHISSPLGYGDILYPGEKRHKCGLLRFLPEERTDCHSFTLENDGTGSVGLYDGNELLWQLHVPTCDQGCALTFNDNGKVFIGEREAVFSITSPSNVSPWPFSQIVKNSYKKRKQLTQ